MALAPFVIVPELTAVAVAYRQGSYIADDVLPRVPVSTKQFRWQKYALGDAFTAPETLVGRKGTPNQVEFGSTEVNDACQDHALDAPVPNDDITQWETARANGLSGAPNPLMRATSQVQELIQTRREKRAADLVFNAGSYGAANKATLSGTSQWSDPASDPQAAIADAMDTMIMRPNIAVFGRASWSKTRRNTTLVQAYFGKGTTKGSLTKEAFAELFELQDVFIGEAWWNTAAKGQPPSVTRLWGKHCALLHRNLNADTEFGMSFGMTAQFGDRFAGTIADSDIGARGGQRVRSGESVKEFISANDIGYFFQNAVA